LFPRVVRFSGIAEATQPGMRNARAVAVPPPETYDRREVAPVRLDGRGGHPGGM
jgi:hypothetical protein